MVEAGLNTAIETIRAELTTSFQNDPKVKAKIAHLYVAEQKAVPSGSLNDAVKN